MQNLQVAPRSRAAEGGRRKTDNSGCRSFLSLPQSRFYLTALAELDRLGEV
jgi:hypothetical protein